MSQDLIDKLEGCLTSDGWLGVLKPNLTALRDGALAALCMPGNIKQTSDGKISMTDDYLKGKIDTLNWMLMWDSRLRQLAAEMEALQEAEQEIPAVGTPYAPQAGEANPTLVTEGAEHA